MCRQFFECEHTILAHRHKIITYQFLAPLLYPECINSRVQNTSDLYGNESKILPKILQYILGTGRLNYDLRHSLGFQIDFK